MVCEGKGVLHPGGYQQLYQSFLGWPILLSPAGQRIAAASLLEESAEALAAFTPLMGPLAAPGGSSHFSGTLWPSLYTSWEHLPYGSSLSSAHHVPQAFCSPPRHLSVQPPPSLWPLRTTTHIKMGLLTRSFLWMVSPA